MSKVDHNGALRLKKSFSITGMGSVRVIIHYLSNRMCIYPGVSRAVYKNHPQGSISMMYGMKAVRIFLFLKQLGLMSKPRIF